MILDLTISGLLSQLSLTTTYRWGKIRNVEYNPIYFETRDTGLIENKIILMMSQARRQSTLLRDSERNSSLSLMPPRPISRRSSLVVGSPVRKTRCLRKLLSANVLTVEVRPELSELSCQTLQTLVSQDSQV